MDTALAVERRGMLSLVDKVVWVWAEQDAGPWWPTNPHRSVPGIAAVVAAGDLTPGWGWIGVMSMFDFMD